MNDGNDLDLVYLLFAALAVVARLRRALALVVGDLLAAHRIRGEGALKGSRPLEKGGYKFEMIKQGESGARMETW